MSILVDKYLIPVYCTHAPFPLTFCFFVNTWCSFVWISFFFGTSQRKGTSKQSHIPFISHRWLQIAMEVLYKLRMTFTSFTVRMTPNPFDTLDARAFAVNLAFSFHGDFYVSLCHHILNCSSVFRLFAVYFLLCAQHKCTNTYLNCIQPSLFDPFCVCVCVSTYCTVILANSL